MIARTTTKNQFLFLAMLSAIVCTAYVMQTYFMLNWDVSWCLHVAARLIAGGTYITDFFDVNLPLTLSLYAPPILFSKFFGLSVILMMRLYILLLAIISISVCFYFLRKIFSDKNILFPQILTCTIAFILLILPSNQAGEREHFFLLFTLPYFIALSLRFRGDKLNLNTAIALGCYAAIGFVIKPYFFVTFILLELGLMFYSKNILSWMRPEAITITLFTFIYLVSIFIFYPNYIHGIVPLTKYFYQSISVEPWLNIITCGAIFYAIVTCLFYIANDVKSECKELSFILLITMAGGSFYIFDSTNRVDISFFTTIVIDIIIRRMCIFKFFSKNK